MFLVYVFMPDKRQETYETVFHKLKEIMIREFGNSAKSPEFVITDREFSAQNAFKKVWPTTTVSCCNFHMQKDALAYFTQRTLPTNLRCIKQQIKKNNLSKQRLKLLKMERDSWIRFYHLTTGIVHLPQQMQRKMLAQSIRFRPRYTNKEEDKNAKKLCVQFVKYLFKHWFFNRIQKPSMFP